MRFWAKKKKLIVALYYVCLISFASYTLLDAFVIPSEITGVASTTASETAVNVAFSNNTDPIITGNSYEDENIKIKIETTRQYDSTLYIADIVVSDPSFLKTAFADDSYGRNLKATTSSTAEANNAIFAINGDYYGFRDAGFVLRNGILYQTNPRNYPDAEALMIDDNGDFSILNENSTDVEAISDSAWQIFTFGPSLIDDGELTVDSNSQVDKEKTSNPRTAIGQISELHYIVIVSDGRSEASEGLTLFELANTMKELGCETAYNLDGGGSSTMYFNGSVINNPTSGKSISEREVSDIVYFGY